MENENQELNQQEAQNNEARTYTADEYNKLLEENSALKEQQKASTKEAQKLHWISEVATDNTKFFKLYRSDKRQAEEVAKHFGWSAKEFYNAVKEKYWESNDWLDIEDVEAKAEEIADKKFAQRSLDSFKKEYGIEWKLEKVWKAEFDGLMEWKDWKSEEVLKQAKRALKLCRDTDEFQTALDKAGSRLAGAGITWGSKSDWYSSQPKWEYARRKEKQASDSIFAQYGKKKDF